MGNPAGDLFIWHKMKDNIKETVALCIKAEWDRVFGMTIEEIVHMLTIRTRAYIMRFVWCDVANPGHEKDEHVVMHLDDIVFFDEVKLAIIKMGKKRYEKSVHCKERLDR